MDWRRLVTIALLTCAVPAFADAGSLAIEGKYGDKAGCRYARTGESDGSDIFFLLTPESVTTATAYCEVKTTGKSKAGDPIFVVFTCQAEGEEGSQDLKASLRPEGGSAYTIVFRDGTVWGPLNRCK